MTKFCSKKSVTFCRRRRRGSSSWSSKFFVHFCRPNTRALHSGRNSEPTALRCSRARPSASLRSEKQKLKNFFLSKKFEQIFYACVIFFLGFLTYTDDDVYIFLQHLGNKFVYVYVYIKSIIYFYFSK